MPHLWLLPQRFGLHVNDLRGNIWTAANGWYRPTWRGWVAPQYGPLDTHHDAWHTSKRRISRDFSWFWRKLILGLCFEAFEPWSAMFFCSQVPSSYPFDLAANFTASTSNIPVRCLERSDFFGPEVSSRASSKTALKTNPSVYKVKACKLCFACIILVLYNPNWWANMFGFP